MINRFIEKARKVHDNKYDYSKVDYKHSYIKVIIICTEHGEFEQKPYIHLQGNGCPKCAINTIINKTSKTNNKFIEDSITVHGNIYDYSKVNYINSKSKVIIICPEHGEFEQKALGHIQGQGCPKCWIDRLKKLNTLTNKEFIQKAIDIHGNKYNYSKIIYTKSNNKVIIICPEHGEFEQRALNHLQGQGCPKCKAIENSIRQKYNKDEFIKRAKETHKNRYDYSEISYVDSNTKVIIKCPKHGKFNQRPAGHLNGAGCPKCKMSKGEIAIWNILQKHNIKSEEEYTIPKQKYTFRYDFYLQDYNLLIEFHGVQHYEYNSFFHRSEDVFLDSKNTDDFKKNFAITECGYRFLEFNYKQLQELSKEQFEELVISKINKFKLR